MESIHFAFDLKRTQQRYDQQINLIINEVELQRNKRQIDMKECEEIARSAARMSSRWKRTSSLAIESLSALRNDLQFQNEEMQELRDYIEQGTERLDELKCETDEANEMIELLELSLKMLNDQEHKQCEVEREEER